MDVDRMSTNEMLTNVNKILLNNMLDVDRMSTNLLTNKMLTNVNNMLDVDKMSDVDQQTC